MADESQDPTAEERKHRRGLKFRKREDYAIELFREARANLRDTGRVHRILIELGRLYNPYTNTSIVDLSTRQRVLERLDAGDLAGADRLLDERLRLYAGTTQGDDE